MEFNKHFEWYKSTQMTSCISLRSDDVIVQINADDVMHSIKIGWCHSLFVAGKEQVTSEFPRVDVIKNVEIIIYKQKSDFYIISYLL